MKQKKGKKIQKLDPEHKALIDQVNCRRIKDKLTHIEIRVLECQYCRSLFESVERKSCGCTRVEGLDIFQED